MDPVQGGFSARGGRGWLGEEGGQGTRAPELSPQAGETLAGRTARTPGEGGWNPPGRQGNTYTAHILQASAAGPTALQLAEAIPWLHYLWGSRGDLPLDGSTGPLLLGFVSVNPALQEGPRGPGLGTAAPRHMPSRWGLGEALAAGELQLAPPITAHMQAPSLQKNPWPFLCPRPRSSRPRR